MHYACIVYSRSITQGRVSELSSSGKDPINICPKDNSYGDMVI
jgi:hypothetical protein